VERGKGVALRRSWSLNAGRACLLDEPVLRLHAGIYHRQVGVSIVAKVKSERSAGGVVYQEKAGDMQVALIATRGARLWGLPKGHIEKGEKPLEAALREVREETGLSSEPVGDLGHIEYWYRDSTSRVLCHKWVQYYLLQYVDGDLTLHGWEVDDARWFPIDEALDTVSYENEREVLSRAREHWSTLPAHGG
jgi:8-oxo-dGTP diphosphatase